MRIPGIAASILLVVPLVAASAASPENGTTSVVDLAPTERAAWTPKNVLVGVSSVFGGWSYWYDAREIQVETSPADADLGLYYLRQNFQKRFERSNAPAVVKLPPRADMTKKDSVRFLATASGYLSQEVSFDAKRVPDKVTITLKALPNSLVFLGQTSFAERTTLTLRTTEQPEMRVSKSARFDGFQIALSKTALKLDTKPGGSAANLKSLDATQLGEDAIVRVETTGPDVEVRSKQSFDPVRSQHVTVFDLVRAGSRAPSDAEIRAHVDRAPFAPSPACDERYAEALRAKLGEAALADAFRPSGDLSDLYLREAMLRLGRFDQGSVRTTSGETLRTGSSLELALALQSAANVKGFLALLGAIARTEPVPEDALRSLIAPELSPAGFAPAYRAAEDARASCHR
jgi:hypothetical protein